MSTIAKNIIAKCGGPHAVAEMLGLNVASVHKWKYSTEKGGTGGLIPTVRAQELLERARKAGVDLKPEDFFENAEAAE